MPNIKSQIKRARSNEEARAKNSSEKNRARTAVKKVELLAAEGKKEEAKAALSNATSILDSLAQAGVLSVNSVARKKAHLQRVVDKIA